MAEVLVHLKAEESGFIDLCGNEWINDDTVTVNKGRVNNYSINISNGKLGAHTNSLSKKSLSASEDWTISLWNYKITSSTWDYILGFYDRGNYCLQNHDLGSDSIGLRNGNNVYKIKSKSAQLRNQWVHIAIVNYNKTMILYVNGISQQTTTSINSMSLSNLYIGNSDGLGRDNRAGLIDDLIIVKGLALWTDNFIPPDKPYEYRKPKISLFQSFSQFIET